MTLYKLHWPEVNGPRWSYHTDCAPTAQAAIEMAKQDKNTYNDSVDNNTDLTIEVIPLDGSDEIILWYGPDA